MYLVLSLLFFVVAFFDPREELSLLFEPPPETVSEETVDEELQQQQEILDDLAESGIIDDDEQAINLDIAGGSFNFELNGDDGDDDDECNVDAADLEEMPAWIARRLTVERLQRVCERTRLDDGRALADNLLDNIPAALIILLPLMALALKILYPLSKRYYVEHLLFFVHFHSFFFLILSLQILFMRVTSLLRVPEAVAIPIVVITSFYVPIYLFVSMRRVYGQGRLITSFKYIALVIAYLLGFFATMLGALAIAAFSI